MNIIGNIIIFFCVFYTLHFSYNLRYNAKSTQEREMPKELQGFLMTVAIIFVLAKQLSPFNLLWIFPATYFVRILSLFTPLRYFWFLSSIYYSLWYIGIKNNGRKYLMEGQYENAIIAIKKKINQNKTSRPNYG